jgi:hypothetical protein
MIGSDMDNTIIQLHDGSETTLSDLKEAQVEAFEVHDKFIAWEAMRLLASTQGGEP